MQYQHVLVAIAILLVGYVLGSKFPQWGARFGL